MRYLCFDIGDKRTGVAVGDDETGVASPVSIIECAWGSGLLKRMLQLMTEHEPDEVVVGLPLNMDGTRGESARRISVLAETLSKQSGKVIRLHDERLSSFAAEESLSQSGLTHQQKKQRRDAIAAALILRSYLEGCGAGHSEGTEGENE